MLRKHIPIPEVCRHISGRYLSSLTACMAHEAAHIMLSKRFGVDWYDQNRIPINWLRHENFAYEMELRCLRRIDPENPRIDALRGMLRIPGAIPEQILYTNGVGLVKTLHCSDEKKNQVLNAIMQEMVWYNFARR